MQRIIALTCSTFAISALVACGGDDHDDHGDHSVAEEFCEHAADGPFQSVTTSSAAAGAPSATFEHTSVTLTLVDYMGEKGGCVSFEADEAGEFGFAVSDADIGLAITDASGAAVAAEKTETIGECAELARMDTFDLEQGTYTLCFGPSSLTEVKFGFEELAHGDHEGHSD